MKSIILISFLLLVSYKPEKLFIDQNNKYSVWIESNTIHKHQTNGDQEVEVLVFLTDSNELKYTLTLSKPIATSENLASLKTKKFIKEYENECGCNVKEIRDVNYTNFKGVKYDIALKTDNLIFNGYGFYTVRGGELYYIMFLSTLNNYTIYSRDFGEIMNKINLL